MRQTLQLRLGQQLTMTPQLQQAIKLLQLSSLELQTEIQTVLDSNLMLEQVEENPPPSAQEAALEATLHGSQEKEPASNGQDSSETEVNVERETTPDELPVDSNWEDVYEAYDGATSYSRGDESQQYSFEQQSSGDESLHDYLTWQMQLTPFSDKDRLIAEAIIDSISDSGYLTTPLEQILEGLDLALELEFDEVVAVLHRIQRFDPPGIGARDPSECLLLQLKQLPAETPWLKPAMRLVEHHLALLAGHDFNTLMRRLKVSREELQDIISLIQSLDPHPGTSLASDQTEYIAPDVYVKKDQYAWHVDLNPDNAPRLRINSEYSGLVRRADNSADNVYLKNHLQEARWFLKSLQNRNETLLRVAICIVEHQRDFLEHGEEYMKPLVLREIAEAMEMHESTISRVTTQKYMHTPRGIYEFKFFFSSHVGTSDGGEASSVAIRAIIKKLISEENPQKPLSDSKLTKLLDKEGINVARRTVAKYRELMSIASSSERKRLT